jgi:prepilin-type processing-associated H-X9-DG protein
LLLISQNDDNPGGGSFTIKNPTVSEVSRYLIRHHGGSNFLYFDGHVEWELMGFHSVNPPAGSRMHDLAYTEATRRLPRHNAR